MKSPTIIPLWPKGGPNAKIADDKMPGGAPGLVFHPSPARKGASPRACVLVCPGGGYCCRADHEGTPFAELFQKAGMASGVIHYRVSPNRHPAPFADVARAIRLVRKNAKEWGVDPNRIGLMGFSAGGHLASTVGVQPNLWLDPNDDLAKKFSARPDRLILGYPVISFIHRSHGGSCQNLFGEDVCDAARLQLSNELHVNKDTPPTFLFHTANDSVVPVPNSLRFAEACSNFGVPHELHVFEDGPHGVGLALDRPKLRIWTELLLAWLSDWTGR